MRKNQLEKAMKNVHSTTKIVVFLFFIIGLVAGFLACTFLTKNDCFKLIGDEVITLQINQDYVEEGATATLFGKDISDQIKITSNVDTTTEGEYYVLYNIDNIRYKNYTVYRTVIVEGGDD